MEADLKDLMDDAIINISESLSEKIELYKNQKNILKRMELKKEITNLFLDRRKVFLFDKETIKKYI